MPLGQINFIPDIRCSLLLLIIFMVRWWVGSSDVCEQWKVSCENDTDCYHRLFYTDKACSGSVCKGQCKTAVLRLYESRWGRGLLGSDLSCLGGVDGLIRDCHLHPANRTVHCAMAKLMCQLDDTCVHKFEAFENQCGLTVNGSGPCGPNCAQLLSSVLKDHAGASLIDCTCWTTDDPLCRRMVQTLIDPCKVEALESMAAPHSTATNRTNTDFRNTNSMITVKKLKEQEKNRKSGGCGRCPFRTVILVALLVALTRL